MQPFEFVNPVEIRFGRGRVSELAGLIQSPALVVTGRTTLDRAGLRASLSTVPDLRLIEDIPPNATAATIDVTARAAAEVGARTIIGLGGGSAMDAARCVAVLHGNFECMADLAGHLKAGGDIQRKVRLLQASTTAGTGSEVTRWASVWDEAGNKTSLDVACGYADVAIVDPALCDTMPPRLTAATGLDAMAHAMEAMWGVHSNPFSDAYASHALELIGANLLPCLNESTIERRDALSLAATEAGMALSNTRSAAAHALSYALTGRFGLEHGLAVGILCRALLPVNAGAAPARVDRILKAMGMPSVDLAGEFIDEVFRAAGMEPSLAVLGVPAAGLDDMVETAFDSNRLKNNPGQFTPDSLRACLEAIR